MKIKLKLDKDQEDKLVAQSIKEAYEKNKQTFWTHINKEDCSEIRKACQVVYHYYTGKVLK
jgi:hypothetical protein